MVIAIFYEVECYLDFVTRIDNAQPINESSGRYLHKQLGCLFETSLGQVMPTNNDLITDKKVLLLQE
jgi:hypothetical protein